MILLILHKFLRQLIQILIDQPNDSIYSVPSPSVQEIFPGKSMGTIYYLVQKVLDQRPIPFHIFNIPVLGKFVTLSGDFLHHSG